MRYEIVERCVNEDLEAGTEAGDTAEYIDDKGFEKAKEVAEKYIERNKGESKAGCDIAGYEIMEFNETGITNYYRLKDGEWKAQL